MTDGSDLSVALPGRPGFLSSFAASPTARRIVRVFAWSFWTAYFVFVLLVL
jgi:hypothetical protein